MGTCERVGINNIITFDMGGTSCDVALIHEGNPVITAQGKINLRPIALPMLDIHTCQRRRRHNRAHRRRGRLAGRSG